MMPNARPRPKIIDKQRPEVISDQDQKPKAPAGTSDRNMNLGVPKKLRQGSDDAFKMLARRNAAMEE